MYTVYIQKDPNRTYYKYPIVKLISILMLVILSKKKKEGNNDQE